MSAFNTVQLGVAHAQLAAAVHAEAMAQGTGDPAWTADAFAELLRAPGTFGYLALEWGDATALVLARVAADEAEILTLATRPGLRRRGYAAALMQRAALCAGESGAERLFLEVAADNLAARALYARLGFVEVGRRRGYYQRLHGPAMDCLVLALDLQSKGE